MIDRLTVRQAFRQRAQGRVAHSSRLTAGSGK